VCPTFDPGNWSTFPISQSLAVVAINQKQTLGQLDELSVLTCKQRINTLKHLSAFCLPY